MDIFTSLIGGLFIALEPLNFAIMLGGLAVGTIAGALPGISFVNAMAMALPPVISSTRSASGIHTRTTQLPFSWG